MSLMDSVQGLSPNSFSSIFSSQVMNQVYFFLKVGFGMAVFFGVVIVIWKFYIQYNTKITLVKRIGTGGTETVSDWAKEVTDDQNKRKLQLLKTRRGNKQPMTCPIPSAKFKGKSGRKDHFYMWMDDNSELHPISPPIIESNFEKLTIKPQERDAWRRLEDDRLLEKFRKKDKLLQYAAPAILMTACITAFLIFFFASKELGSGMASLAASFQQVASSCISMSP